jgi:hypothetical protein
MRSCTLLLDRRLGWLGRGGGGWEGGGVVYCLEVTGAEVRHPWFQKWLAGKADYCYMVASACPILFSWFTTSPDNTISLPRTLTQERPVTGLKRQCLEIFHR